MIDIEKFVLQKAVEANPLMRIHLIAMRWFGYILFDDQKRRRLHCFRGVILSVSFVLFNITQVSISLRIVQPISRLIIFDYSLNTTRKFIDLFQNFRDINEITKNAATTLLFATTSFRMINFYWNRLRYINIIKAVDDDLKKTVESADEIEKKKIERTVAYMRNLTASFWISALITGNLMCINSAVQAFYYQPDASPSSSHPPSILRSWFPFEDYWNHFWVIYAIQYYVMNVGMLIVPCWHVFIVSIMVFVILKLKILNHQLCAVDGDEKLVKCVNEREKLFGIVRELSSLISSSLLLDFIVFSILLCALLFQATQVNRKRFMNF